MTWRERARRFLAVFGPAIVLQTTGVKPGDDFFGYANSAWLETAAIPNGATRWGARDEISALARSRVVKLIDDASLAPAGSMARKVADFRAAYANEEAIDRTGLTAIEPFLARINDVRDKTALARLLGRELPADVDPLNLGVYSSSHVLGLAVERSIHGEKFYDAFLLQGGLGLGNRDAYLGPDPHAVALRSRYQAHMSHLLALADLDRATERAAAVMALETAIAETHATSDVSANDHDADHRWTRADFERQAPGMNWSAFFAGADLAKQSAFVVWQPTAVIGLSKLVASRSLETWKDYLRFHVLLRYADVLPPAFADEAVTTPRAERAVDATRTAMSDIIGQIYAERYFSAGQKARVQAIVANVIAAFAKRVEAVAWMTPASKAIALAKLKTLYVGIGYPERWQDYSDLTIDPSDPVGNLTRLAGWHYRRAVARIGQPVDMRQWWIAPEAPGAVLIFQQNAYEFAAALLEPPKFDSTASDAAMYGSIGAIIGHDVTHFVDVLGAEYDSAFAERRWWTAEDSSGFEASVRPLVRQFSDYRPFPNRGIDGARTETENVADLAGLEAAFDAYRRSLGDSGSDQESVRRRDREFFIAFARGWRTKVSDEAMRAQLATDSHAPEKYRVATVRNMDAWYDAFNVDASQRLYLAPGSRVRVW